MTGKGHHHKRVSRAVKVLHVESDKWFDFPSITNAAKTLGIDPRRIYRLLTEGGQVKGYAFYSDDPYFAKSTKGRNTQMKFNPVLHDAAMNLAAWRKQSLAQFIREALTRHVEYMTEQKTLREKAQKALEK